MDTFDDIYGREIRFTEERWKHIENEHPEMSGQIDKIKETLLNPDKIIKSKTDESAELFYQYYPITPVTSKYLCVVVKLSLNDLFAITAYFTGTIKKGELLWEKK
jgi:hypothetical protein